QARLRLPELRRAPVQSRAEDVATTARRANATGVRALAAGRRRPSPARRGRGPAGRRRVPARTTRGAAVHRSAAPTRRLSVARASRLARRRERPDGRPRAPGAARATERSMDRRQPRPSRRGVALAAGHALQDARRRGPHALFDALAATARGPDAARWARRPGRHRRAGRLRVGGGVQPRVQAPRRRIAGRVAEQGGVGRGSGGGPGSGKIPAMAGSDMTGITHRTVETNGIRMHVAEQGAGPLVVLCHGFPESWYSWRHQLAALADAGFHAVAPDMRGYGRTDAPAEIDPYTLFHLA